MVIFLILEFVLGIILEGTILEYLIKVLAIMIWFLVDIFVFGEIASDETIRLKK